jgi:hypothetical protein
MTMARAEGFIGIWRSSPPLRAMLAGIGAALGLEMRGGGERGKASSPKLGLGEYLEGLAGAGLQVERVKRRG